MGQQQVFHDYSFLPFLPLISRRMHPLYITELRHTLRFINRKKHFYSIRKMIRCRTCISPKNIADSLPCKPAFFKKRLRQIPMKKRHNGFNTVLQQTIHQFIIKSKSFFVPHSVSQRKQSGPGNRKPISAQPHFFHDFYIFLHSMIMITGNVSVFHTFYFTFRMRKNIPYRRSPSILFCCSFYLIRRRCRPPHKIFRKSHNHLSSHSQFLLISLTFPLSLPLYPHHRPELYFPLFPFHPQQDAGSLFLHSYYLQ